MNTSIITYLIPLGVKLLEMYFDSPSTKSPESIVKEVIEDYLEKHPLQTEPGK